MPSYPVDAARTALMATGIVDSAPEWEETSDGRRRPSQRQARDQDTGMPLWQVEVLYQQNAWNRVSTVTTRVTVPAETQPQLAPFAAVSFDGLAVEVHVNRKSGALAENWRAESLVTELPAATSGAGSARPSSRTTAAASGDGSKQAA